MAEDNRVYWANTEMRIGPEMLKGARQIIVALDRLAATDRFMQLQTLMEQACHSIDEQMPNGVDCADMLAMAQMLAASAVAAQGKAEEYPAFYRQWVLAQAIDSGLVPMPSVASVQAAMRQAQGGN